MTLQHRIRNWLGITQTHDSLGYMDNKLMQMQREIAELKRMKEHITIHNRALARFIGKLDPLFASNEFDPRRKAESDRIGDEVMRRLIAEHKTSSNPHE